MQSDPIASEYLEMLTKLTSKIRTAFNQQVTEHGLTYPRARALFRLAKKQNLTQSELALDLELEQPTLVRLLDRMEENGLIERRADPKDRRAKLIALTRHGEEQAALVRSIADRLRDQIFKNVSSQELRTAVELLGRVSVNVDNVEPVNVTA